MEQQSFALVITQESQGVEVEIARLGALTSLTFRDSEFETLPGWITTLPNLSELVLINNKLKDLPDLSPLQSLKKIVVAEKDLRADVAFFWSRYVFPLRKIDMSHSKLKEFPAVILELFPLMKYPPLHMDLSDNHISVMPNIFQMTSLHTVQLEGNPLHPQAHIFWSLFRIPKSSICLDSVPQMKSVRQFLQSAPEYSKHIECFQIKDTKLLSIPAIVGSFTNLRILSIPENSLTSLPSHLSNLSGLTYLNAMRNNLSYIPQEVSGLKNLNYFDLGINKISTIPEDITHMKNLSTFLIYGNKVADVPEYFARLMKLVHVDFEKNEISSLPKSFKRLQKIQYLNLCNNKISSFPAILESLTNLNNLNLARCQIQLIPESISSLVGLSFLDFRDNLNHSIPQSLYQMTFLRCLRIGKTTIGKIPDISNFRNLLDFNIQYELGAEESFIMSRFISPGFLNLSKCAMTKVHPSITKLPLTAVDLSENLLTEIPSFLEKMEELKYLNLSKNPLSSLPVGLSGKPHLQVVF